MSTQARKNNSLLIRASRTTREALLFLFDDFGPMRDKKNVFLLITSKQLELVSWNLE